MNMVDIPSGDDSHNYGKWLEIVGLSIEHGGSFHSYVSHYQRVWRVYSAMFSVCVSYSMGYTMAYQASCYLNIENMMMNGADSGVHSGKLT